MEYNYPTVQFTPPSRWWKRSKWILKKNYIGHTGTSVPKGFKSDGVTVPRGFNWLISPTGQAFPAAIIHDYILVVHNDPARANRLFREELAGGDVGIIRRNFLYGTVVAWWHAKKVTDNIMTKVKTSWNKQSS